MTRDWRAFERIPILSGRRATGVFSSLRTLQSQWIARTPWSFTLGAASYLDAIPGGRYHELAADLDPLLASVFGELYDRVVAGLAGTLGEPVELARGMARPGFHLYFGSDEPTGITIHDGPHWDWNMLALNWDPPLADEVSVDDTLSFTLPIVLPRSGSGLEVWPGLTSMSLVQTLARQGRAPTIPNMTSLLGSPSFMRRRRWHLVPYRVGELVLHSGHVVHRSPPLATLRRGDRRITLQGHGIRRGGRWQLFW